MTANRFLVTVCLSLIATAGAAAEDLPILRLADMAFQVGDLGKVREFYGRIMGFEEAFTGTGGAAFFKVNDDQYLEFIAAAASGEGFRVDHISLLTGDVKEMQRLLRGRQLSPSEVVKGDDGNPRFTLADPDGTRIEFVEYLPASPQARARGRKPAAPTVADHLLHAALAVNEAVAMPFYRDKLGFREFLRGGPAPSEVRWINMMMPGKHGDYVELMVHAASPVTGRQHLCFEVEDMQAAYRLLVERGVPEEFKPFLAQNKRRIINLRDGNGIRVELMESKISSE